ncbi:MAG: hypothetical protein PHZ02_01340 [Desulfocapsaceae bacterium]|nr:hypothetical protein [Desulfocapsaceae bacterium]
MPDTQLNLKDVLKEEQKAKLSAIDKDFYEKAHVLFKEIKNNIDRTNPDEDGVKYNILTSDLNVAKINFESILEIRMGKIVKEASIRKSLKQKEQHEPENLIPEEKKLYDVMFGALNEWRSKKLHDEKKVTVPESVATKKVEPCVDLKKDFMLVRMLITIPTFVGSDMRNYTLRKEEIATIPVANARALISKNAAVQIGVK